VTLPKKASLELNGAKHFAVWKTIDEGPVIQARAASFHAGDRMAKSSFS